MVQRTEETIRPRAPWQGVLRNAGLLLLATYLSVAALELPYGNPWYVLSPTPYLLIELAVVGLAILVLTFLGQRRGVWAIPVSVVCLLVGIAQHYVNEFKGTAFMPSDLLALETASAVAGKYAYEVTASIVCGVLACALACVCLFFVRPTKELAIPGPRFAPVLLNVGAALVCAVALALLVVVPNYIQNFGVVLDYWSPMDNYRAQGFVPTFVGAFQDMCIPVPPDYSSERAQQIETELAASYDAGLGSTPARKAAEAQYAKERPSILVVMNETFADLSDFYRTKEGRSFAQGYEGPAFFNERIAQAGGQLLDRGALAVSAYGGGTCNTEFEYLTGATLAFIGGGKYPFQMYDLSRCDNIGRQLAREGYRTYAMHPNLATNWNRARAYDAMGFDRFLSIDDFPDAPEFHSGVTDRATYQKALELLSQDGPQLVFDVTMQNHSGYGQNNIDPSRTVSYELDPQAVLDEGQPNPAEVNEYLSCIQASDEDLEWLIGQLSELDEHVILVFFGDHQPEFTWQINDALYDNAEGELVHAEREFRTNWFVWANYEVDGASTSPVGEQDVDDLGGGLVLSTNQLVARALELAGAPLTNWQKAKLCARSQIPAINLVGYLGGDCQWHEQESQNEFTNMRERLHMVDYLNFGSTQM
ncbi:MAG: LTA synthase family protein [Coriobacteriales bacterium]|nr:LTA synthase family protein [Coriobacteriales bacterium]